jgi:hypothetical protein
MYEITFLDLVSVSRKIDLFYKYLKSNGEASTTDQPISDQSARFLQSRTFLLSQTTPNLLPFFAYL